MAIAVILLAGSIAAAVPAAVDKTLAQAADCRAEYSADGEVVRDTCQLPEEDPARLALRIAEMEAKLKRVEEVADATSSCVRSAFIFAGGDQFSTAASLERCPACSEQNPFGLNPEARIGLKLAQLGVQIDQCYRAAKRGKTTASVVTWINRIVQGLAIVTNGYSAITGKPLYRWGAAK